jgi:hypothetical protein
MNRHFFLAIVCGLAVVAGVPASADDTDARAKLTGKWQQQGDSPDGVTAWTLQEKDTEIHVIAMHGSEKLADFECNTLGRECKSEDSGHAAKISFWFSGPSLVEMETRGSDVLKRRFSVSDQTGTMDVEVTPIVPAGRPETIHFTRVQESAAQQTQSQPKP